MARLSRERGKPFGYRRKNCKVWYRVDWPRPSDMHVAADRANTKKPNKTMELQAHVCVLSLNRSIVAVLGQTYTIELETRLGNHCCADPVWLSPMLQET